MSLVLFPRTIQAAFKTAPAFPDGMQSWGMQGKGQFRAGDNVGRTWQETYNSFRLNAAGRALITAINQARREKIIWDIQHPDYRRNNGTLGGSPIVDGSDQTGAVLNVTGGTPNVTGWLKAGDIIQACTLPLVLDVTEDVDTNGDGDASIPIHPPLFAGGSPPDTCDVEIDAASIYFKAVIVGVQMSDISPDGIVGPGMVISWREQPS